jgi:hypothetical protein
VNTFARCSANSTVLSSSLLAHFGLGAVSSLIGGTCCLGFFRCLIGFQIVGSLVKNELEIRRKEEIVA